MKPDVIGDTRIVLRAMLSGTQRVATFYGGGAQCGIGELGLRIVLERSRFGADAPREIVGSSIGAVAGLLDVFGVVRSAVNFWPKEFSERTFLRVEREALFANRIMRLSTLEDRLVNLLKDKVPAHAGHNLHVAVTDYETGKHDLVLCNLSKIEEVVHAVIASCGMPTITRSARTLKGRRVSDGDIGNPLPIQDICKTLDPPAILIVLPYHWTWFEHWISIPIQNRFIINLCNETLPTPLQERMMGRSTVFFENYHWIQEQLKLPIGSPQRTLPPTAIAFCPFQGNPLETNWRTMWRSTRASVRFWSSVLQSVT